MSTKYAELAISKALGLKATEAEAYVQRTKIIKVEFSEDIDTFKTTESIGMGLRVALGKKTAMYSTSILNERQIDGAAAKAVKMARVAPEDPDWNHLNRKFGKTPVRGCYDNAVRDLEYKTIVDKLRSSIKLIRDYDSRVKPARGILALASSTISVANSCGQSAERKETGVAVQLRTKAAESGMESTGNEHQEARYWKQVDFEDLAAKAAEKAVRFLKAKPMSGGKTDIIVRNQIFANLLGIFLHNSVSADWVQKGKSPLARELGNTVAAENITMIDDPTMPSGWGTRPFDDEGCPTQKTPLIEKGVLKNFLYDTYTALKAHTKSTGNAQRAGYWVKPLPLPNNLVFKAGETEPDELIQDTREGILVETTIGEWLSNPVSGNLNATITHGYRVKKGELAEPVKGVVISGNFYELLKKGITGIANDVRNSAEDYSPTVRLTQITVAGE